MWAQPVVTSHGTLHYFSKGDSKELAFWLTELTSPSSFVASEAKVHN